MKKIPALLLIVVTGFGFSIFPQCDNLVFFKEGTAITITNYNKDGDIAGSNKTVFKKVSKSNSGVTVTATQENYNKKGKPGEANDYEIRCSNGVIYFDMKMLLSPQQSDGYKDMEMKVEGAGMELPSELVVGSTLKDVNVKFTFSPKGETTMPLAGITFNITNRKVEAKERVTTPAGTFDCYKITEDTESKTIFTLKYKTVTWFSFEAGNVKVESYKENGKFMGRSELTELRKG